MGFAGSVKGMEHEVLVGQKERIAAVIVAYHPDRVTLSTLLATLAASGVHCLLVDNSEGAPPLEFGTPYELLQPGENLGIATAQNLGIRSCLKAGFRYVVLFDQDSVIGTGFIPALAAVFTDPGVKLAAPVFYDRRQGFAYPLVHVDRHGRRQKIDPTTLTGPVEISTVISSGLMIKAEVFEDVGLMDEGLFIDYVDTEWCLRCAAQGIRVKVDPAVRMRHAVGDDCLRLAGFLLPVHSSKRRYYRVRNAFLLWCKPWVPRWMLIRDIVTAFIHQGILAVHAGRGAGAYLRSYCEGVADGLRGRTGK